MKFFDCETAMPSFSLLSLRCFATCGAKALDCFWAWKNVKIRSKKTPTEIIDITPSTPISNLTHQTHLFPHLEQIHLNPPRTPAFRAKCNAGTSAVPAAQAIAT